VGEFFAFRHHRLGRHRRAGRNLSRFVLARCEDFDVMPTYVTDKYVHGKVPIEKKDFEPTPILELRNVEPFEQLRAVREFIFRILINRAMSLKLGLREQLAYVQFCLT
jgi:hypothetical protein